MSLQTLITNICRSLYLRPIPKQGQSLSWSARCLVWSFLIIFSLPLFSQSRYVEHSALSTGKWVKIRVKNEGVYQLTKSDLTKMGFNNPERVKLYGYNVPMLPEAGLEDFDDDLTEMPVLRKSDGTMLFYSPGTTQWSLRWFDNGLTEELVYTHKNNPYSTHLYYFLSESDASPLTLEKSETTTANSEMTTFLDHALVEKDEFGYLNAGRTFFEAYNFADGNTHSYSVPMPDIASTDVNVDIQYVAAGKTASTLTVSSGGEELAMLYFKALPEYEYGIMGSESFLWCNVVTDKPVLRLHHPCTTGVSGHLDYIRATYERKLNIGESGFLAFRTMDRANYSAVITGANETTRVLRITSPSFMQEMYGQYANGSYTAVVTPSELSDNVYVAINTNASFPTPETVGTIAAQDLHAIEDIDFVIITPANGLLNAEAQRLADAHTLIDGMKCVVVQADWIYNEFSSGTPDATAYRRFLKMLYDKSEGAGPRNVLLFGRGVWDNRMITSAMRSQKQDDYLLCYESENAVSHTNSYTMEEYFTLLADGKGVSPLKEKPDCGVGRLPVANAAEAHAVVSKLIRYMQGGDRGGWLNTICFMADDGNANLHGDDAENVWKQTSNAFPEYRYKKIYWDAYEGVSSSTGTSFPSVYAEINKVMNDGALIMNYTGHGAAYCLSAEQVLKTSDFQGWKSPRLPLWITAACDVMPFDMNTPSLGVEAVLNPSGAAMGFIGTARTVYSSQNKRLNRYFMKRVLGRKETGERYTIGEALSAAKADIVQNRELYADHDSINKAHFVLVGDPAITLPLPDMQVRIDKINGKETESSEIQTISAGQIVTIEGHIEDLDGQLDETYYGLVSPTVLDCIETITCKDNDGSCEDTKPKPKQPMTYKDRPRELFSGTDSIRAGRFTITFPIPLDISYANDYGLITLYATNNDKTVMAQGTYSNFLLGGTSEDANSDTDGPVIVAYLDNPNFSKTCVTPTLYAALSDSSGINTSGAGLGHDITAIIDNNEKTTYTLNSYYTQTIGDHRSGTLVFTVPALPEGKHTLTLRAFDTFNNMSEQTIEFEVIEGLHSEVDYFDFAGRQIQVRDANVLPKGIYIKRLRYVAPVGVVSEKAEKIVVK